jgi:hypothetical protein
MSRPQILTHAFPNVGFQLVAAGAAGYLPEKIHIRNARETASQSRAWL